MDAETKALAQAWCRRVSETSCGIARSGKDKRAVHTKIRRSDSLLTNSTSFTPGSLSLRLSPNSPRLSSHDAQRVETCCNGQRVSLQRSEYRIAPQLRCIPFSHSTVHNSGPLPVLASSQDSESGSVEGCVVRGKKRSTHASHSHSSKANIQRQSRDYYPALIIFRASAAFAAPNLNSSRIGCSVSNMAYRRTMDIKGRTRFIVMLYVARNPASELLKPLHFDSDTFPG